MSRRVFISYSRQDGEQHAHHLEGALNASGFHTWRDKRNINPARDFTTEIEKGIQNCDVVALCLTPDTRRDESFVRREIQYALAENRPVFICRFHPIPPPISVINNIWLEFHDKWDLAFDRLLELINDPKVRNQPGDYDSEPDSVFRDYLQNLYRSTVRYLNQTVNRFIHLKTEDTSEVVQRNDLLREFRAASIHYGDEFVSLDSPLYETLAEAFGQNDHRMLLLGEPGAGKTISLMAYARDAIVDRLTDSAKPLPIVKSISSWDANRNESIADWCARDNPNLKYAIKAGNALLLLDGLDELGREREILLEDNAPASDIAKDSTESLEIVRYDPRKRFIDTLEKIPAGNRVLIACRAEDYAAIGQQIALHGAVTLQPLTDAQIRDYLQNRRQVLHALQTDPHLMSLARTPLLLVLITHAFNKLDQKKKPGKKRTRGEMRDTVFEAYCKHRFTHEIRKKNATLPIDYHEMIDILGELAMWNANDIRPGKSRRDEDLYPETNVLTRYDFEYVLGPGEHIRAFQKIVSDLNIMAPINDRDYRFVHLYLRDYLAYTFALPRIVDQEYWYIPDQYQFLIRRAISTCSPIHALGNLADTRAIPHLIDTLHNREADIRMAAAGALGKIGLPAATPALIETLYAEEVEYVRLAIVHALDRIGDTSAIDSLIQALGDAHWRVREAAVQALKSIGEPAIEPLIRTMEHARRRVQEASGQALVEIGPPAALPLVQMLKHADSKVREIAAEALGAIRDDRAMRPLIDTLADTDKDVRRASAEALGKIGNTAAITPLIIALDDDEKWVRRTVVEALGNMGDKRAIEPVKGALRDQDKNVCRAAARALDALGWQPAGQFMQIIHLIASGRASELTGSGAHIVEPLITAMHNAEGYIHRVIIGLLGRLEDDRAVEPLIQTLQHPDVGVRSTAAWALGAIASPQAVAALVNALYDDSARVQRRAAYALVKIGEPAVQPLITVLEQASDHEVRGSAARALGVIGSHRAVNILINMLNDPHPTVQRRAAESLGNIGDPHAIIPLIQALHTADAHVHEEIEQALFQMEQDIVPHLIDALQLPDRRIRRSAVTLLGERGDERAIDLLIALLEDADSGLRQAAAFTLIRLGWQPPDLASRILMLFARQAWDELIDLHAEAVPILIMALSDTDEEIQWTAIWALGEIGPPAVPSLMALLEHEEDTETLFMAAGALGLTGDQQMLQLLRHPHPAVRGGITASLGTAEPPPTDLLIRMLEDNATLTGDAGGMRVCDYAFSSLQQIGTRKALRACDTWHQEGNAYRGPA